MLHICNILQAEQLIFVFMCILIYFYYLHITVCTYIHSYLGECVCNEENLSHESEQEQEGYGECIGGKKGEGEMV